VLLPPWGMDDARIYSIFNTTHVFLSYGFVALIVLHVAAALRHVVLKDGVFPRMLLSRRSSVLPRRLDGNATSSKETDKAPAGTPK